MSAQDLEQRAREFLAAEYERDGKTGSAEHIRTQPLLPNKARAVRAIVALIAERDALREALGGVMDRLVDRHESDEAAVIARRVLAITGESA